VILAAGDEPGQIIRASLFDRGQPALLYFALMSPRLSISAAPRDGTLIRFWCRSEASR
jgi:hypothetical protein